MAHRYAARVVTTLRAREGCDALFQEDVHHLQARADSEREETLTQLLGEICHRDRDRIGHDHRGGCLCLVVLLHGGGPLAVRVTWWSPEHLPEGRRQAGDRHLKFHDERDNLKRDLGEPFENGVALGGGIQEPVRHHHEYRVGKVLVTPPLTEACEVGAKTDAVEVTSDRRNGTIGRSTRSLQLVGRNPVLVRVARERGDDAIELSGALELTDLAQAEQLPLGVLAAERTASTSDRYVYSLSPRLRTVRFTYIT